MPSIARGQENTSDRLNWFTSISGTLTDMQSIGFQILDLTAGSPGTQIFPATLGDYEEVSVNGKFGTGSYYAYDGTAGAGWTPSLGATLGAYCIKWRWRRTVSSPYQENGQEFEVIVESSGSSEDTYCSVLDLRALGVPDENDTPAGPTDAQVLAAIQLAQALFERATRNWFSPRTLQFKFDGTNSDAIHLGVPIINVEWLKINGSTTALDEEAYAVYNSRSFPDDRRNPRIKLIRSRQNRDIYTAPGSFSNTRFMKGRHNCEVRGTFGFVEEDGNPPLAVKEAVCRMAIERLENPAYGTNNVSTGVAVGGSVIEEWTDGHRLKYAVTAPLARRAGLDGFTRDPLAQDAMRAYRAPLGLATPAHYGWEG